MIVDKLTKAVLSDIVNALRSGGVIAVPTDTIYGVACLAQSAEGISKIYSIKCRDNSKPLAILVPSVQSIEKIAVVNDDTTMSILRKLLPGPVTAVLRRQTNLNPGLNPEISSIGVRVIDTDTLTLLMSEVAEPLALTSANVSGKKSSLCISDFEEIHSKIDFIIDGGNLETPRDGSTVIDLTIPGTYHIVRKGQQFENTLSVLHDFGLESA